MVMGLSLSFEGVEVEDIKSVYHSRQGWTSSGCAGMVALVWCWGGEGGVGGMVCGMEKGNGKRGRERREERREKAVRKEGEGQKLIAYLIRPVCLALCATGGGMQDPISLPQRANTLPALLAKWSQ